MNRFVIKQTVIFGAWVGLACAFWPIAVVCLVVFATFVSVYTHILDNGFAASLVFPLALASMLVSFQSVFNLMFWYVERRFKKRGVALW